MERNKKHSWVIFPSALPTFGFIKQWTWIEEIVHISFSWARKMRKSTCKPRIFCANASSAPVKNLQIQIKITLKALEMKGVWKYVRPTFTFFHPSSFIFILKKSPLSTYCSVWRQRRMINDNIIKSFLYILSLYRPCHDAFS